MSKAIAATAARVGETPVIKNWLLDEEFLEKLKELYGPDYDWAVNTMSHESSGIANAHNTGTPDNPENSRGLMQINWDFWGTEPNFREEFKDLIKSEEDLFDPIINAMAGKYILATEGKSPWAGTREKVEAALAQAEYPGTMDARPREAGTSDYWTERADEMQQRREDLYKGQEQEVETKITKEEGQPTKEVTTVKGVLSDAFDPERWITPDLTPEVQQTSLLEDARLAGITGPEMDLSAGAEVWPPEDSPYRPTDALHGDITRGNILRAAGMPQEGPIPSGFFHDYAPGIAAPEERGFPPQYFDPRMGVGPSGPVEYPDQRGWFQKAKDYTAGVGGDIASYIGDTQAVTSARERIDPNIERAEGFVQEAADPYRVLGQKAVDTALGTGDFLREAVEPYKVLGQNIVEGAEAGLDFLGITEPDEVPYQQLLDRFDVPGTPWYENQALGQGIWRQANKLVDLPTQGQIRFLNHTFGRFPELGYYILNQFRPEDKPLTTTWGTTEYLSQLPDKSIREVVKAVANKDNLKNIWSGIGEAVMREGELIPSIRDAISPAAEPAADLAGELQTSIAESLTGSPDASTGELIDALGSMVGGWGADIGEAVGDVYTRVREDPSGAFEDFTGAVGTGFTAAKDLVGAGLDFIGGDEEAAVEAPAVQAPSTVTITDKGLTSSNFVTSARGGTKGVTDGAVDVQGRPIYTTADPQTGLDLDIEKEFLDINSTANWLTGLARLIGASDPGPNYRRQRTEQLRLTYEMQRDLLGIGVGTQEIYKLDADGDIIPGQTPTHWSKNKRVPTGYTTRKPESTQQSRASNAMKKELIASLKKGETPIMAAGKAFNKYRMRISAGGGIAGFGADNAVVYREILSLIRDFGDMNNIPEWKNITLQELAPDLARMPGV